MRKKVVFTIAAVMLAACSQDTTGPLSSEAELEQFASFAYSATEVAEHGSSLIPRLHHLPEHLALTAEQRAQIRALVEQFLQGTRADRETLVAILRQAREARAAGKSSEEVRAILQQAIPIRERLQEAEQDLIAAVEAVLTPEQRAWLAAHQPTRCRSDSRFALTETQKAEISALIAAFVQDNQADVEAVKAAFEAAREARQNGATREEIRAILQPVRPALERLRAAARELAAEIIAVLTPEQRASGCFGHLIRWPRN